MSSLGPIVTFDQEGLIPAIVQDAETGEVLMLAYMNREALNRTVATQDGWYWSRSRRRLWRKGETSGHAQRVRDVRVDCDGDALLVVVEQIGAACHTGRFSCFYRDPEGTEHPRLAPGAGILGEMFAVIQARLRDLPESSHTAELFRGGHAAMAAKVSEESEEFVRAARDESDRRVVEEAADLLYHSMVLLAARGVELNALWHELEHRRRAG